jgi:hypothetical protein
MFVAERVAVLETVPVVLGLTTTSVIVAKRPKSIVPRVQLTVLVPEQGVPCDGVAETNVVPAGRMSVTVVSGVELPGPEFLTVML